MKARRAILYVPGDDMHKITKAASLGADCVCLDMEDAVALNQKEQARSTIVEALKTIDFGRSERLVRINSFSPGSNAWALADLQAVLPACPDGIVLPKVETPESVIWAGNQILDHEKRARKQAGSTALLAMLETARGMLSLPQIAAAAHGLQAIIFGGEDYLTDITAQRTAQRWEVFYARSHIVTCAAAYQLQAIDMIYVNFKDTEGLIKEAQQGAQMGFSGKQIIHPAQIEAVQAAFTPGDEAIARARALIEAFDAHQRSGKGVFALDDRLVELPHIKAAQKILALAHAAGKL